MIYRHVKLQRFSYNDDREVLLPDTARIISVEDGFVWAELPIGRRDDKEPERNLR